MTRKDYVLIAAAVTQAGVFCETKNQTRGVERAALCLATALETDNPNFNRARFLEACGV